MQLKYHCVIIVQFKEKYVITVHFKYQCVIIVQFKDSVSSLCSLNTSVIAVQFKYWCFITVLFKSNCPNSAV